MLHPLPAPFHTVSSQPRAAVDFLSIVPPTATTPAELAGYDCTPSPTPGPMNPLSPVAAKSPMPGRVHADSCMRSPRLSPEPQLKLMPTAPLPMAMSMPVSPPFGSISMILQSGHPAVSISMSSELSPTMPLHVPDCGKFVPPLPSTWMKQPLALVQGGRPYCMRYALRSASALG